MNFVVKLIVLHYAFLPGLNSPVQIVANGYGGYIIMQVQDNMNEVKANHVSTFGNLSAIANGRSYRTQVVSIHNQPHLSDEQAVNGVFSSLHRKPFGPDPKEYKGRRVEIQVTDLLGKRIFFHTFRLKENATTLQVYPETILHNGMYPVTANVSENKPFIKNYW